MTLSPHLRASLLSLLCPDTRQKRVKEGMAALAHSLWAQSPDAGAWIQSRSEGWVLVPNTFSSLFHSEPRGMAPLRFRVGLLTSVDSQTCQRFGCLVIVDSVTLAININGHSGPDWEQGPWNSLSWVASINVSINLVPAHQPTLWERYANPAAHPLGEVCVDVYWLMTKDVKP